MTTIDRRTFRLAIHRGIEAARQAGMTAGEAVKLYRVGREAADIGVGFEDCPMTRAGLYSNDTEEGWCLTAQPLYGRRVPHPGWVFVDTYDDDLSKAGCFSGLPVSRVFHITD